MLGIVRTWLSMRRGKSRSAGERIRKIALAKLDSGLSQYNAIKREHASDSMPKPSQSNSSTVIWLVDWTKWSFLFPLDSVPLVDYIFGRPLIADRSSWLINVSTNGCVSRVARGYWSRICFNVKCLLNCELSMSEVIDYRLRDFSHCGRAYWNIWIYGLQIF